MSIKLEVVSQRDRLSQEFVLCFLLNTSKINNPLIVI